MRKDKLSPQPFTLEGFLSWAIEAGHYPAVTLYENFREFSQNCIENKNKFPLNK